MLPFLRLPRLKGRHARAAGGRAMVVESFNHDGLELARVKRKSRWMPVWHIVFFVYLMLLIRLVTMAEIGPAAYGYRMSELQNGSAIERLTARVMYMDPVSRAVAVRIRSGMKSLGLQG